MEKSQISIHSGVNYRALKTAPLKLKWWSDRKHHNLNSTYIKLTAGKITIDDSWSWIRLTKHETKDLRLHETSPAIQINKQNASWNTANSPSSFQIQSIQWFYNILLLKIPNRLKRERKQMYAHFRFDVTHFPLFYRKSVEKIKTFKILKYTCPAKNVKNT